MRPHPIKTISKRLDWQEGRECVYKLFDEMSDGSLVMMTRVVFSLLTGLFIASVAILIADPISRADAQQAQEETSYLAQPLFTPAVDYQAFPAIPGCKEEAVREVKYYGCRESRSLYEAALANAKEKNQPLMVIFGFNRCPYCVVLERAVFNPERPVLGRNVARYFSRSALTAYKARKTPLTIPVLRLHARSDHGLKLADELGITKMANDRGWHRVWSPFVVMVNPKTGAMTSESEWEAKEIYCDWSAGVAVSLEKIQVTSAVGAPISPRRRCPKK